MFPSPCGVLVLKSLIKVLCIGKRNGFRPLAGFWFLNAHGDGAKPHGFDCFRPLAGFWFLNTSTSTGARCSRKFPSPCGVLVLKYDVEAIKRHEKYSSFRPLAGFWFLNLRTAATCAIAAVGFRPLAGFWFLNAEIQRLLQERYPDGFRPLAGFWFLNSIDGAHWEHNTIVSVPLRGSGS